MPSTADRQVRAHAQCGGGGGEGAASTPLDAQRLGPLVLQISEPSFASSMAQGQMGLAPFPPGCQPEGTFSTPLSTSGGEGGTLIQHPSSPASFGDETPFLARGTQWRPDVRHELLTSLASAGGGPPI